MAGNWLSLLGKLSLVIPLTVSRVTIGSVEGVIAQVVSDPSLGGESSVVTPINAQLERIDGGAIRGANLFHSFREFNIGEGRRVDFANPTGIGAIFSRVTGSNPSHIFGTLGVLGEANLFLINPHGILFGPNAQLDMRGSFVASTANSFVFSDGSQFSATSPNAPPLLTVDVSVPVGLQFVGEPGAVVNTGDLAVESGENLTLVGGTVVSTGELSAPGGEVALLAVPEVMGDVGKPVVELTEGGQLLGLSSIVNSQSSVSEPQTLSELLTGAGNLAELTVTDEGEVQLTATDTRIPTDAGIAIASGNIDVSGDTAGKVQVLGDKVGLIDTQINASGSNGGGTVLIGGDYQGVSSILNAERTYISSDSVINVDALVDGDGGQAIAWADGTTGFYGKISARGGSNSGNGGFVEVSGKENLIFRGEVDTSALQGNFGTLLLDPQNITIVGGPAGSQPDDGELNDGVIGFADPGDTFTISSGTLEAITGQVMLEASNDIVITPGVSLDFADGNGAIAFTADADMNGVGNFVMDLGDTIRTDGRAIEISAASITAGSISTDGGNISLTSIGGDITTADVESAGIFGGGIITLVAEGNINTNQLDSSSNGLAGNGGKISLDAEGDINVSDKIKSDSFLGNSGWINLEANGDIYVSDSIESDSFFGDGGDISLKAEGNITTLENIQSFSVNNGDGGNVTFDTNGNITTVGEISSASNDGDGGAIKFTSNNGSIDTTGSILRSSSTAGSGGSITLSADRNITTTDISSSSREGNSGEIFLHSRKGGIDSTEGVFLSGSITGNGARTTLLAETDINTGDIFSLTQEGNSGEILINSNSGSITAGILNSNSLSGNGGEINLSAERNITTRHIASASRDGNSGEISITSNSGGIDTTEGNLNSGSVTGNGAAITISAENDITTARISSSSQEGNSGAILLDSNSGSIDTTEGTLSSGSRVGKGATTTISAEGDITTANIFSWSREGDGGEILLESNNGSIDTTEGTLFSGSITGNGAAITVSAENDITTARISSGGNGKSGEISLESDSGSIDTTAGLLNSGSILGNGAKITVSAENDINTASIYSGSRDGNSGEISLESNSGSINTTEGSLNSGSSARDGSPITLTANGNIVTRDIFSASNQGNGGKIQFNSHRGAIDTTAGTLFSISNAGNAGEIALTADSNITIEDIQSVSFGGNGGEITLKSHNGAIETTGGIVNSGSFLQHGGNITFTANRKITIAGIINSDGNLTGGDITLQSTDDINLTGGNLNSSGKGTGGSINLTSSDGAIALENSLIRSQTNSGTGGDFNFHARSFSLSNSNVILLTRNDAEAGNINITATEFVDLNQGSSLLTKIRGTQPNGNLTIDTQALRVRDGSNLSTSAESAFSTGSGGILTVNADLVNISGTSADGLTPSTVASISIRGGNAGDVRINTNQLTLRDGGSVAASTFNEAQGGNVVIKADSVVVTGTSENQLFGSGISVDTLGSGKAGELRIDTNQLLIQDGGVVSASTFDSGEGGTIKINAGEIFVSGASLDNQLNSGIYAQSFDLGKAGSLEIFTGDLLVENGAKITVSSEPTSEDSRNVINKANALIEAFKRIPNQDTIPPDFVVLKGSAPSDAGDITIDANYIFLNNQGEITAVTSSGKGGDINIDVWDLILMRHESEISATAGTAPGGGNGGNITINAPFIVAVPHENSDITANAFTGNGGTITIFSQAIFGLKFRPNRTHLSDITVTSTGGGIDGIFELNTLGIDPSRGLIALPNEPVNTELDEGCQGNGALAKVEFFEIGRAGLPASPDEPFDPDFDELVSPTSEVEEESNRMVSQSHRCSVHP
ncbi:MAG: filamentous hemagglutinin N-terminal domain-containing protein [Symploca sp. SIO2C1]|nr:filamentous hemagglutinin N-terminal domain-containing protein [Symploca sp. SIO2C1]